VHPLTDPIVAPATPPGVAALGIVRMSGPEALNVADSVFRCTRAPLSQRRPRTAVYGHIHDPDTDEVVDDVVALVFRAPRSYTGQDVVEFTCHGNPLIMSQVLHAMRRFGARDADPGEFTYRAYMNGRMDLMQCEAVADLIHGHSQEALRAARRQQRGIPSSRTAEMRSSLIEALAGLEYAIDFPDESPEEGLEVALTAIRRVRNELASLSESARRAVSLRDSPTVAIVGRPNVGKSSLFNALAGRHRSIVTARPGTTRDIVEEPVRCGDTVLLLQDTAGVRVPRDHVEREGVALATETASCADLVLLVLDARRGWTEADRRIADALAATSSTLTGASPCWRAQPALELRATCCLFQPPTASVSRNLPRLSADEPCQRRLGRAPPLRARATSTFSAKRRRAWIAH